MLKVLLFSIPIFLFSLTLDPQPAVQITSDTAGATGISVASNSSGFMAAWQNTMSEVVTSFSSDQGATWSLPVPMADMTNYKGMVVADESQFVVCWVRPDIGYSQGNVVTSGSTDQGATWSTPVQLSPTFGSPGGTANPPAKICVSSQGFMVAWSSYDTGINNVWSNFSSDGVTWDEMNAVKVNGSIQLNYNEVSVAGNAAGFMMSWLHFNSDTSLYEIYGSFSTDRGGTWSTPFLIYNDLGNTSEITLFATSAGFLATWSDLSGNGYAIFSSDNGNTWSAPTLIATNLFSQSVPVSSSGTSAGFVLAYLDFDGNIGARVSSNGRVWDAPVSVVSDDSAAKTNNNMVGVSAISNSCMFAWLGEDGNVYSSYSPFSASSSTPKSPSTFFRTVTPNKPKGGLFD